MNPICKVSIESPECQRWMADVCAHCSQLLATEQHPDLWDAWWPNELTTPYNSEPSLMSAFDCHKLKRDVARQMNSQPSLAAKNQKQFAWQMLLSVFIVFMVVAIVCFMARMFLEAMRCDKAGGACDTACIPLLEDVRTVSCDDVNYYNNNSTSEGESNTYEYVNGKGQEYAEQNPKKNMRGFGAEAKYSGPYRGPKIVLTHTPN